MSSEKDVIAALEERFAEDRKRRKQYGQPGSVMKASDGTLYEVQPDGSWRRVKNV